LALAICIFASSPNAWRPGSDGHYSYLYARSLAFDGDIDFRNDYRLCGDPFRLGGDRGSGRPDNIFYAGPAIFWTPVLLLMRAVGVEGDGCGPPWTVACLSLTLVLGALAVFVSYRFVSGYFGRGIAALSVGAIAFGGPALLLTAAVPSYSQIYDLFFAACLCWVTTRIAQNPGRLRLVLLASATLAALILQRASNLIFALLPVVSVVTAWRSTPPMRRLHAVTLLLAGVGVGVATTAVIAAKLYGGPWEFSHGPYFLNFAQMHPFLALFNREAGLFFFWPTVWLAVPGAILCLRDPSLRLTAAVLACIGVFELLLSSAALDWSPARRLLNLVPALALFAAGLLERVRRWTSAKEGRAATLAAALAITPLAVWSCGYAWGASHGLVPIGRPLDQQTLYGGGVSSFWAMVDRSVGTLPVWPAEAWYSSTRDLPRQTFGDAAFARFYLRDFRTLAWLDRRIDLATLHAQGLTEGLEPSPSPKGLRMVSSRARAVFTTQWPHVTDLVLRVRSDAPTRLKLGVARWRGTEWLPEQSVAGSTTLEFDARNLELGSGLQELVFEIPDPNTEVILEALSFDDREPRTPIVRELGAR
jgi:hypothetical protein